MKRYRSLSLWLCLLSLSATAAHAQSYRLNSLSEQLSTQANDLAERSYTDYTNNRFSNRSNIETLFLAQQFSASANVFRRMVRDSRRNAELRDAASILTDLSRRGGIGGYSPQQPVAGCAAHARRHPARIERRRLSRRRRRRRSAV